MAADAGRTDSTGTTIIRTAGPEDHEAILDVVGRAFTSADRDASEELDIVAATWKSGATFPELELVAIEGDAVVGHVLAATADLSGRHVVAVAPLAVTPSHQGAGIGTALMTELLRRADAAGLPMILLLGSPHYYGRFGFEPSGPLGITYRPVGEGHPDFQVRRFATYDPSYRGDLTYCWESESD